jgi:hypothetical protein
MLLTNAQLAEFRAEGTLLVRGLIPGAVLAGWRRQFATAAAAHSPPVETSGMLSCSLRDRGARPGHPARGPLGLLAIPYDIFHLDFSLNLHGI